VTFSRRGSVLAEVAFLRIQKPVERIRVIKRTFSFDFPSTVDSIIFLFSLPETFNVTLDK